MSSIWDSVFENWITRTRTPFYGIFFSWWFVLHFQFFYTLLFVDQEQIYRLKHVLKNEYIWSKFIHTQYLNFWLAQGMLIIFAFLLTIFMIKYFPKLILNRTYSWGRDNELDRQVRKIKYLANLAELKAEKAENKMKETESEKATEDLKQDIQSVWRKDYKSFRNDPAFQSFELVIDCVYEYGGRLRVTEFNSTYNKEIDVFKVPSGTLAFVDGYDLVEINNVKRTISFTDKGRYFVRLSPFGR